MFVESSQVVSTPADGKGYHRLGNPSGIDRVHAGVFLNIRVAAADAGLARRFWHVAVVLSVPGARTGVLHHTPSDSDGVCRSPHEPSPSSSFPGGAHDQTASDGARLLATSNAVNAVSRILTGYAGDKLGRQNTLVITLLLAAGSVFAFWLSNVLTSDPVSSKLWPVFITFYSFSAGGYYALFPALIAEVFGLRQYAAVNAFVLFVRGLGTMFGSPMGGQLVESSREEGTRAYASVAYWDGALLVGAVVCCVDVRWADAKGKGWKWIA